MIPDIAALIRATNSQWRPGRVLRSRVRDTRNMHTSPAPYSYGLAARARRIYNDVACSGGQGVRSSRRMLPLEATRPGLLGTPGLVYSLSHHRSGRVAFRRSTRINGTVTLGKAPGGTRSLGLRADDQSDPRNCQMISSTTITSMTSMILRPIPPWIGGSKFTLSCRFAPTAGFRC